MHGHNPTLSGDDGDPRSFHAEEDSTSPAEAEEETALNGEGGNSWRENVLSRGDYRLGWRDARGGCKDFLIPGGSRPRAAGKLSIPVAEVEFPIVQAAIPAGIGEFLECKPPSLCGMLISLPGQASSPEGLAPSLEGNPSAPWG